MADIADDVLQNILGRLPGKALLRFRCASKHWNGLISDPYFMKSIRSRRMILLPFSRPLAVIDDKTKTKADKVVRIHNSPLQDFPENGISLVSIVGTFNGIVLLALTDNSSRCHLFLYNPLTCASKKIVVMDPPPHHPVPYVFGCGSGSGSDDLKIVRFVAFNQSDRLLYRYKYDLLDLKTSSWRLPHDDHESNSLIFERAFCFSRDAATFLNGFLYWSTSEDLIHYDILALNLKEMVFSRMNLPDRFLGPLLGSIDGCLSMVNKLGGPLTGFRLWTKEHGEYWFKASTFSIPINRYKNYDFYPICILRNGKILLTNRQMIIFMYDPSNSSCETLYDCRIDFKATTSVYRFKDIRSIEYVESLLSPSDIIIS